MPGGNPRRIYADASALVKLVLVDAESQALEHHLSAEGDLSTAAIALVEVSGPVRVAFPEEDEVAMQEVDRTLDQWSLVAVDDGVLARARKLVSQRLRSLDAIHVAAALEMQADEFISYDNRQLEAAAACGLRVASPGRELPPSITPTRL